MQAVRRVNDEVYYTAAGITLVGPEEIAFLKTRAAETPRRRARLCAHPDPGHGLHEMLIVHGRDAYVRPHRHIGKSESQHVVEGRATVLIFDEAGQVTRRLAIGGAGYVYYRVDDLLFHSMVIESDWFVFHETITGPFDPTRTEWAPWAPDGRDEAEAARYMTGLRSGS